MSSHFSSADFSALNLRRTGGGPTQPGHFVEFYEDESVLLTSLKTFISRGIAEGDSAILIAQPSRRDAFEDIIEASVALRRARDRGRLVSLDAEETLGLFMMDDMPDPARFERAIYEVVKTVARPNAQVRAFGEMVAVLWEQGNTAGAIALEDLWNDFITKHPLTLFCAYPVDDAAALDPDLIAVCDRHSHVLVPPNSGASS